MARFSVGRLDILAEVVSESFCKVCQGNGVQLVPKHDLKAKGPPITFPIICYQCNGSGLADDDPDYYKSIWCVCGNPSGKSHFYDYETTVNYQDKYDRCDDCAKLRKDSP